MGPLGLGEISETPEGVRTCLNVCRFPICGVCEKLNCCGCCWGVPLSVLCVVGLGSSVVVVVVGVGFVGFKSDRRDFWCAAVGGGLLDQLGIGVLLFPWLRVSNRDADDEEAVGVCRRCGDC